MVALREIIADFGIKFPTADAEKADATIEGLIGTVRGFAGALGAGLALGAIKRFTLGLVDQADNLRDQATALGLSVEELQQWNHAGALNGLEDMSGVLQKFNRNVNQAKDGSKQAGKAFKDLGIDVKGALANGGRPIDLLDQVAAGLAKIQDPAKRTAIAMDLFGRSGAKLLPLFSEGPEGLKKLRAEVAALGGGITNDFADQSDELNDNIARLDLSLLSFRVQVVSQVVPAITWLVTKGTQLSNWVRNLTGHTKIIQVAFADFGIKGLLYVSNLIGPLGAAFTRLGAIMLRSVLPLLLVEDLFVFLAGGDSLFGRALDKAFGPGTQEKVRGFTDDVGRAVRAFDRTQMDEFFEALHRDIDRSKPWWRDFADSAVSAGELAWNMLTNGWTNFKWKLSALAEAISFLFEVTWSDLKNAGALAIAYLSDGFTGLWNGIVEGAARLVELVNTALAKLHLPDWVMKAVSQFAVDVRSNKGDARAVTDAQADARYSEKALGVRAEQIEGWLKASPTTVSNVWNNKTEVTVPPGTPAEQADAVGKAAEGGAKKGAESAMNLTQTKLRAAKAALTHHENGT